MRWLFWGILNGFLVNRRVLNLGFLLRFQMVVIQEVSFSFWLDLDLLCEGKFTRKVVILLRWRHQIVSAVVMLILVCVANF